MNTIRVVLLGIAVIGVGTLGASASVQAQPATGATPAAPVAGQVPPRLPEGIPAFPGAWGGGTVKLPVENLTIQWCISSEALNAGNHAFGGTWGGRDATFHHNLFACNTGRNPSIGMPGEFDYRNNVVFNRRHRTMDGGDETSPLNVINNCYQPGPATNENMRSTIARIEQRNMYSPGRQWEAGN